MQRKKILLNPMNFCCYRTDNRAHCLKRQCHVLFFVFLTILLGCLYYSDEHKPIPYTISNIDEYSIRTNEATKFIQNTLENEYNHEDLTKFYRLVQKEISLGLHCTRTKNLS